MRTLILFTVLSLASAGRVAADPAPRAVGHWSRYAVAGRPGALPPLTEVVLSIPPAESIAGQARPWVQLEVSAGTQRQFALALQVASLDFLYACGAAVEVFRYVLFPAQGPPIEYVDAGTGRALLPKIGFWTHLLPHAQAVTDPDMPLFGHGTYLGRDLHRLATGKGARLLPVAQARRLLLDPRVLIGTSRSVRDPGGPRLYQPGAEPADTDPDYTYVSLAAADYQAMIEAGMNLFDVPPEHLAWVIDEPVFFLLRDGLAPVPELLYRSNYFGAVQFMDEPAIRAMAFERLLRDVTSPAAAAELVIELTRGRYQGDGVFGAGYLATRLRQAGYDLGPVPVRQPDFPVWETVPGAVWYEMEAGAAGWLLEARLRPVWFADLIKSELGVDFPADTESCIRYHYAFCTGAARRFGAQWGVSTYGQMDFEAAARVFPLAYDRGATYFWFWTSDHAHHVPFDEQLALSRAFRDYARRHPRPPAPAMLTPPAEVAIALPWGYLCDHYQLKHYPAYDSTFTTGRMWWSSAMEMTDTNAQGVPYRQVLAAATAQAATLLRQGTPFDFIFLHPDEAITGYRQVIRVRETGEVAVEPSP
jgi:hypothetical protein